MYARQLCGYSYACNPFLHVSVFFLDGQSYVCFVCVGEAGGVALFLLRCCFLNHLDPCVLTLKCLK